MAEFKLKSTEEIKVSETLVDQVIGQEAAVKIIRKAAQQRRHVLLIGEPGTGKCVGKESFIQLSDGSIASAGDLFARINGGEGITALAVNPDLSLSHTRLLRAAQVRAEAFEFTTQTGKRIVVSAEHPFLSIGEKGVSWVFAKDLKQGAFVASCRRVEATGLSQRLPVFPAKHSPTASHTNVKTVRFPEFFDDRFAEFCGYLWSEGYIARGQSIQFTNEEKNLVDRFVLLARQLFAIDAHVRYFPRKRAFVATLQSSTVGHALRSLGWGHGIPDVVMKSPRPVIRSFLRAYFDGDGSMTSRGFEVVTKNARIASQLQSLLLRFDVQAVHRRRMMRATNSTMAPKEYRVLVVYDAANLARLAEVGFSLQRKQERFREFVGKRAQSNIDKIPHIGKRLFELKERLRLTAEDLDIDVHQFARYIKGTRIPTRTTVQKIVAGCAQRFVALRTIVPRMYVDGSIDVQQVWVETGISHALVARRIGISIHELECLVESRDPRVLEVTQRVLATCISQDVEEMLLTLVQVMDSDVTWERVKSMTAVGTQDLYDFEAVGTHNFIADNLVVHNSMLGLALAELLPKEKLVDIISFPNPNDENQPLIRTVPAGQGRDLTGKARIQAQNLFRGQNWILFILVILSMIMPWWARSYYQSDLMFAAFFIGGMMFLGAFVLFINMGRQKGWGGQRVEVPKVIVDNFGRKQAPFFDGTGAHAGALLGDVLHDPFQCIPGDEEVHLPNGKPVPIKDLIEPLVEADGEYALSKAQQFDVLGGMNDGYGYVPARVTKVFRRRFKGHLVEVETRRGYTVRVTPNHPLAVFRADGGIEYVPAGRATKGLMCVVPERLPITASERLPLSMVVFLAEALADGHFAPRSVVFKVHTPWKVRRYEQTIAALGIKPRVIRRGKDIEICANSAALLRYLRALGVMQDGKKTIPSVLFSLPKERIVMFLARYISIDGYVGAQGQFELLSKEMIPDIVSLLLKIGVRAKVRHRVDTGFGKEKGTVQPRIIFGDFDFARIYRAITVNHIHKRNLDVYLAKAGRRHVSADDVVPVSFDWLEKIREKTGLSQSRVHPAYYALKAGLKTSQPPTRQLLRAAVAQFMALTNGPSLFRLRDVVEGSFAFDEIVSMKRVAYEGPVYNMTTSTGTYLVSNVLTHNSGGLGTPAHERVVAGMIHKANMGVLFIDEIGTLEPATQQELLTSLQEGKYPITGQSERSAGAMVRTEAVPCNFVLVAAGNVESVERMHPALRSRIRGYGYEVVMQDTMPDTAENRGKLAVFVAQEVVKDKKIPHFSKDAVLAMVQEARRMANRKRHLTLRLRELGGLIRAAGDIAVEKGAKMVEPKHIEEAKRVACSLEQQIADKFIERKKEYEIIITEGERVGRVNGLAVIGSGVVHSGIILPIEAEVTVGGKEREIVATGKLGEIAKEAVKNVSAIIKHHFGEDIKEKHDIYVQFLQTYEGVEGDSASIAVATAIISALRQVPVRQDVAMTGSLSVRGEVLPIGGVSAKVEAAIDAGIKTVIVPKSNLNDIVVDEERLARVEVVAVDSIVDVLQVALAWKGHEDILAKLKAP